MTACAPLRLGAIFAVMPVHHVLVVAVDGLRASALGAFGNTTYPTPALDEFAAESFLFDWCYAPSAELGDVYRALWQSIHPARALAAAGERRSLPELLSDRGYSTLLVTDEAELTPSNHAPNFDRCVQVAGAAARDAAANRAQDISGTALARLFGAAYEEIAAPAEASPRLVWVHARGTYGPWDAPLYLQRSLLDDDDPSPLEAADPPDDTFTSGANPDTAFQYGCAYASQVMVLDACWNGILEAVQTSEAALPWLVMLIGARGYPLGEHGRVGGVDARLYGEQLHVPWLIRFSDGRGQLARSGQLTSPLDVMPTLLDWVDGGGKEEPAHFDGMSTLPLIGAARPVWRDTLIAASESGPRAIRTAEWCLRQDTTADGLDELYVRPDDRWETNDVAKLCPHVIERLEQSLAHDPTEPAAPAREPDQI
jgi:arylsulfatase A-like enzyme